MRKAHETWHHFANGQTIQLRSRYGSLCVEFSRHMFHTVHVYIQIRFCHESIKFGGHRFGVIWFAIRSFQIHVQCRMQSMSLGICSVKKRSIKSKIPGCRLLYILLAAYLLEVNSSIGFVGASVCIAISSAPWTDVLSTSFLILTFLANVLGTQKNNNHSIWTSAGEDHLLESGSDVQKID